MAAILTQSRFGSQAVWTIGSGRPAIVLHGGPGLDHSYLVQPLLPISDMRQLIFFDQIGCGQGQQLPTDFIISHLTAQFIAIIDHASRERPVDVIAHSWGAYIVYSAMGSLTTSQLGSIALVSPIGLTRDAFDESGKRLLARVPQDVQTDVERLFAIGSNVEAMEKLLPCYLGNPGRTVELHFATYNPTTYETVIEKLGDYDFRVAARLSRHRIGLIYGSNDIELPSETVELHSSSRLMVLPDAGHFPFAEKPTQFQGALREILTA